MLIESLDEIYPFSRIEPKIKTAVYDEWEFEVNGTMHVVRFLRVSKKKIGPRVSMIDFGIRRGRHIRRKMEGIPNIRKYLATVLKIVESALEEPTRELKTKIDGFGIAMLREIFDRFGVRFARVMKRRFMGKYNIHNHHYEYSEDEAVNVVYATKMGRKFEVVFPGVEVSPDEEETELTSVVSKVMAKRIERQSRSTVVKTLPSSDEVDDITINEPQVDTSTTIEKLKKKEKREPRQDDTKPLDIVARLKTKTEEEKPLSYKINEAKRLGGIDIKTVAEEDKALEIMIYYNFFNKGFGISDKKSDKIKGDIPKFNINHARSMLNHTQYNFLSKEEYCIALNVSGIATEYIYDMYYSSFGKRIIPEELNKKGVNTEKLLESLPSNSQPETWKKIIDICKNAENICKGVGLDLSNVRGKYPFTVMESNYTFEATANNILNVNDQKQIVLDLISSIENVDEKPKIKYTESSKGTKKEKNISFELDDTLTALRGMIRRLEDFVSAEEYIQINEILPDHVRNMVLKENVELFEQDIIRNWTLSGSNTTQYVANKVLSDFGVNAQLNDFYNFDATHLKGSAFDDVIDIKKNDIMSKFEILYNRNQEFYKNKFGKRYEKKTLKLYRGVGVNVVDKYIPGAIESWSTSMSVAKLFGKMMASRNEDYTILFAEVPIQHIFGCYESFYDFWPGEEDLKGKKEYIVMGGTFATTPIYIFDIDTKETNRDVSPIREMLENYIREMNEQRNKDLKTVKISTPSMKNFDRDLKSKRTAKGNDPKENEVRAKENYTNRKDS